MSMQFRKRYQDQLPRPNRLSLNGILGLLGSIASIAAITLYFVRWDDLADDYKTMLFIGYLTLLILLLTAYIMYQEHKKLHRYANAVFYMHFAIHAVRDYLSLLRIDRAPELSGTLEEVLDCISACFSLLTGKQC